MEYTVVPFVPAIDLKKRGASNQVAEQLEKIIIDASRDGWEYVRLESVTSYVGPENGCFGIGARPGYETSKQMLVFRRP